MRRRCYVTGTRRAPKAPCARRPGELFGKARPSTVYYPEKLRVDEIAATKATEAACTGQISLSLFVQFITTRSSISENGIFQQITLECHPGAIANHHYRYEAPWFNALSHSTSMR